MVLGHKFKLMLTDNGIYVILFMLLNIFIMVLTDAPLPISEHLTQADYLTLEPQLASRIVGDGGLNLCRMDGSNPQYFILDRLDMSRADLFGLLQTIAIKLYK